MSRTIRLSMLAVIALASLSVALFRYEVHREILRRDVPALVRTIFTLVFPPSDLYEPLAKVYYSGAIGGRSVLTFKPIYRGKHKFSIVVAGLADNYDGAQREAQLPAKVQCRLGRDTPWQPMPVEVFPFWGRDGDGLAFSVFSVPANLPLDALAECEVSLQATWIAGNRIGGPIEVRVSKMSDE